MLQFGIVQILPRQFRSQIADDGRDGNWSPFTAPFEISRNKCADLDG
jgi:hypothetical protein